MELFATQRLLQAIKNRTEDFKTRLQQSPVANFRPVLLVYRVVREMGEDDATHLAAGVAYYAIFSLFPLLLGFLAILGMVLSSDELQRSFLEFVTRNLPGSAEMVERNVNAVIRFRGALRVVSILGLLWSASAIFGAISRAVNRAWDVQRDRPFYIAKPRQIGMALAVGALFLLSNSAGLIVQLLARGDMGLPGQGLVLWLANLGDLTLRIIPWLITFAIFLLIYKLIPNRKTHWRYVWPGALVGALLFEVAKNLFVWYLEAFAAYDQVYGNLASVVVLLFWAYLSALLLILGAEISSEYERLYHSGLAEE